MINTNRFQMINDLNNIAAFLARRDIAALDSKALNNKFEISQVDLIIILGNSIPYIAQVGANAYRSGVGKDIMISGGIGHATKYLVENILNNKEYEDIDTEDKPEADILKQLILKEENLEEDTILIENKSTNCGSNAQEALKVLKQKNTMPKSILLLQDPLLQLRSHASFLKEWEKENVFIISYAPFIPQLKPSERKYEYVNQGIKGLWSEERFIDLIMGEIPRLKDDEKGYGPKGKGFITHVDIPKKVLDSYERLLSFYREYSQIKNRK